MSLPAGSHTSTVYQCAPNGRDVTHCTPGVLRDIHRTKPFYAVPRAIFDHLTALIAEGQLKSRDMAIWLQAYMRSIGRPDDGAQVVYACSYAQLEQDFGLQSKALQLCLRRLEAARLAKRVFRRHQKGLILVGIELTLSYRAGQQILTGVPDRAVTARRPEPGGDDQAGMTGAAAPRRERGEQKGGEPDRQLSADKGNVARLVALARKWGSEGGAVDSGDNGDKPPAVDIKAQCPPEQSVQVKRTKRFSSSREKPADHGLRSVAIGKSTQRAGEPRLVYANTSPLLRLTTHEQWFLEDALAGLAIKAPERLRLMPEIAWSVCEDSWRCPRRKALEACVGLVAAGRWRTPYSMRDRD